MNFVTIDFETANYSKLSAISIGMAKFKNGVVVDEFYSLINPVESEFRPDFVQIHGLTPDMVEGQPSFLDLWESILDFIGDDILVAHNAGFDLKILKNHMEFFDLEPIKFRYACSLQISKSAWKSFPRYKLELLAEHFGIKYNAHNALADAIVAGKIVNLANENNQENFLDFLKELKISYKIME